MFNIARIKHVNVEITTRCQAACPFCPRNYNGYGIRDFPLKDMTLEEFKTIHDPILTNETLQISFCGTYGDPSVSPHLESILEYCHTNYPDVHLCMHTNGSTRTAEWWAAMNRFNILIEFGLDGLEDTHVLYRQNTNWRNIIRNATAFINAGGNATWQMIVFHHNKHQIEECRQMAKELKFTEFKIADDGRNSGPAYTIHGQPFWIGETPEPITPIHEFVQAEKALQVAYINNQQLEYEIDTTHDEILCKSRDKQMIYVAVNGDVWPCCWVGGTYPATLDTGDGHRIKKLMPYLKTNGLTYDMQEILDSWTVISDKFNTKNVLPQCVEECGNCVSRGKTAKPAPGEYEYV